MDRHFDLVVVGSCPAGETSGIHQPQAVVHFGGTVDYFINATFNVPTASEALKYPAYDGLSRLENRATLTTSV